MLRKVSASIVEISLRLSKWVVLSVHSRDSQFYYGSYTGIAHRRNGRVGRSNTIRSSRIGGHVGSDGEDRKKKRWFGYRFRQMEEAGSHIRWWKMAAIGWNWLAESRCGKADASRRASWSRQAYNQYGQNVSDLKESTFLSLYLTSVIPSGKSPPKETDTSLWHDVE